MGAMVGLVIGYMLGARGGKDSWAEIQDSWTTITTSEEVRDLLAGGVTMAADLVQRGAGIIADRLQQPEPGAHLRRVA